MSSPVSTTDDPFRDPLLAPQPPQAAQPDRDTNGNANEHINVPDTLAVGRDASLTLATDSLIVLDEELLGTKSANCCGLSPAGKTDYTRSIPFYNILWAEHSSDGEVTIQYAQTASKNAVRPAIISYTLDKPDSRLAEAWIEKLLDRAYGASQRRKRIKVLINPFGGQGGAVKMYHKSIAPILAAARCELDVEKTQHQGHGVEIAQNLDVDAYDVVACCSGDGIPHEVWNGLGKRRDAAGALLKVAVVQLPCGTGNAMSLNFNGTNSPSLAALAVVKGLRTPLDLTSITQGDQRTLSFLSQAVGIVAETDLATEHLRWMGDLRFTWGFLVRLLTKTIYPADIAVKVECGDKTAVREAYRAESSKAPRGHDDRPLPAPDAGLPALKYGTINDPLPQSWELIPHDHLGNFYAGNLAYMSADTNFFPASLPADGCLDLVRIRGDIPRSTAIKTLMAVEQHTFFDMDHVDYQKVSAYRIIPKQREEGYISIDGEKIPFEGFQAEVHRGLGTVLSRSGRLCEARGV
ncbi:sphingoid long chain base kinase-like protein [Dothidotthia symphoricarpi CBS 119687]|uniref:Sphingoid long chain base kinase-like protein n=1 Tax=Dothidotthia symphoricarpi CBS 119687 TaxID=1392245 RepID=A0A6A6AK63_9PLEO|nr:sphingoid long chain base kinase-like protein [Dothidotthia symphoricarpi CBS 119687]KAF2131304.1 sphingoid long chain base kinase-like protein [Dothidotthia symphoricarpi CBS 119687]